MRNLLKAGRLVTRHFHLFILTFCSLVFLTFASQLEMLVFGVAANKGGSSSSFPVIGKFLQGATSYFQSFKEHELTFLILVLLVATIIKALALFVSRFTTQVFAIRMCRDLREYYFQHLQSLPLSFYQRHHIGKLTERVGGDSHQIAISINAWILNYLSTPVTLITTLYICFSISWELSCVIFLGLPLIVIPVLILTRKVRKMTKQILKNKEKFSSFIVDFLSGIKTVKIFSMEDFSIRKYREQNESIARMEVNAAKYDLLTRPILHAVTTLCVVVILLVGLYGLKMTMAELLAFCGILRLVYEPVKKFAEENVSIQRGVVAAERLLEVLQIKPEICDQKDAKELSLFEEKIVFEHVWFRYNEEWILKDVSFTIHKGETVAIIGATGSGKSTLLQLLPRLWDVQIGQILIDGCDIRAYTQLSLREKIAYVPQRPFFFYDTIVENIAHGKKIPMEEIIEAAKKAHAHTFIADLPLGYHTPMVDFGQNFSGGQQQRLAIARALVKKAPILLLDEATSSLDSLSEEIVKQAITELHGQMTQIIVAHRLSTIEHADRIIFIENGSIIAQGTRQEVYQQCESFRQMWDLHFQASNAMALNR